MLFFLCDLSGRGVRRFFPHAEDAKDAKAGAVAQGHGRQSLRVWTSWPEIFELWMLDCRTRSLQPTPGSAPGLPGSRELV